MKKGAYKGMEHWRKKRGVTHAMNIALVCYTVGFFTEETPCAVPLYHLWALSCLTSKGFANPTLFYRETKVHFALGRLA